MIYYIIPLVLTLIIFNSLYLWNQYFDYQCDKCGHLFSLQLLISIVSPIFIFRKLVRCPIFGEITFAVPVPKEK